MKKIWEIPQIELNHAIIPDEEFDQLLDEWAEIVYCHLCQLPTNHALVSETLMKRTGTNG